MSAAAPVKPNPTSRVRIACAALAFIASLGVYVCTLAPTVTLVDSGELIVAAKSLGVAHPPGFPLYVLLAHLATLVPISSIAVRVNFTSALFAALASAVVTMLVIEAMLSARLLPSKHKSHGREGSGKRKNKSAAPSLPEKDIAPQNLFVAVVSSLVAGGLLGFSRTLWAYATIAEVYTLNSLLILIIFLLMFRWRHKIVGANLTVVQEKSGLGSGGVATAKEKSSVYRWIALLSPYGSLYAAAFIFGLALGVHHVSVGLMLPAFAALVFMTDGLKFFLSRRLVYAALFAFAGLILIYSYLPLAASRSPIMNWGDPSNFERLWWQVTGRQYQVFFSYSVSTMASQFVDFIKLAGRQFGPWWLPVAPALATAGFVALFRRDKAMFWFLALVFAADLTYALGYEISEDKDAYYLPALIAMAIAAGFGAHWVISSVISIRLASRASRAVAVTLLLSVLLIACIGNWSYNNRSRYFIAEDYVANIFSTVEPGGMLLTRDWQVYSPTLYFQSIEHRRKDAVVIDVNQLRRSWYFDYLRRAYPATIQQASAQVGAYLEDLRHWEQDPDLYQRDLKLNQRINARFYEMILAIVTNHIQSASVYVTLDIAGIREGPDAELAKSLAASYQFVPQGLVFQITTDREFRQPADPKLVTRGLADGTINYETDDVVMLKVLPVYTNMLYNCGRYLAGHGRHEQAIEVFKRSLDLNPKFTLAQQGVNESVAALRKGSATSAQ